MTDYQKRIEDLEAKVNEHEKRIDELEEALNNPSISRRAALGAFGATGLAGLALGGSAAASTSSDADGSIGTEDNPIGDLYVDHVIANTEVNSESGNALWIGDDVDVDDMDEGDYLIE